MSGGKMTIKVKVPRRMSYSLPNTCVCCGEENYSKNFIVIDSIEILSRSMVIFYACNKCEKYKWGLGGGCALSEYERDLLPPNEKIRAEGLIHPVSMDTPVFYLGKVTFTFKNNAYGRAFWELNGGEIIEKK
jgi:hypothetical protein